MNDDAQLDILEVECDACKGRGYRLQPRYTRLWKETWEEIASNMVKLAKQINYPITLNGYGEPIVSPNDSVEEALAKLKAAAADHQ